MVNGWKFLKYISIFLHWMKLTWVIQLWKNVFAINNGIIVLTFHELDLTKGRGRGLHGPESDARPNPARPNPWFFQRAGPANVRRFFQRAGPANERRFFQRAGPAIQRWFFLRAGPGRQMKGYFFNGPGRVGKKEMSSGRAGPGPKKSARADL